MIEGTVTNGMIILDGGTQLPEGARVLIELADPDDLAPPSERYDREKELAILREAVEDVRAGRTRPLDEVMTEIAIRHNLPTRKEKRER